MDTIKPPLQWQADPKWSKEKLGFSNSTIGGWGCLLTCGSMIYSSALNQDIRPDSLNEIFKENKKYSASTLGGGKNNLWLPTMFYGIYEDSVEWVSRSREQQKPQSNQGMSMLRSWLMGNSKNFAILKLDFNPHINDCQSHFVLAWAVSRTGDVLVNDPAFNYSGNLRTENDTHYFGMKKTKNFYGINDQTSIWRYDLIKIK
jgi:hypothetical protein